MSTNRDDFIDYKLPTGGAYANFDATSMKSYINQKLTQNKWFTDQNFEGSNLSHIIDILSYYNHVLLFYLNKTSSESQFSEAQIYENMSRIVKRLGYKPFSPQPPMIKFEATSTLPVGSYVIPRYSFFSINGITYSFIKDTAFTKFIDGEESLDEFSRDNILYEGKAERYPDYRAVGEQNEVIELQTSTKNVNINTVSVYVNREERWVEWSYVDNLYDNDYNDSVFEVRLNERENIELKFGNGINGDKLRRGDIVCVYFLSSLGKDGEVSSGFLKGSPIIYSEPRIRSIYNDISDGVSYITRSQIQEVDFSNEGPSTQFRGIETVDEIRENASLMAKSQNRLISKVDFEAHIKNQFSGVVSSVKVLSNKEFLDGHMGYLNSINIVPPLHGERVLTNHLNYSTSCHFNNVYIYLSPRATQTYSTTNRLNYVNSSLKSSILQSMQGKIELSLNPVFQDPEFMAVDIGITSGQSAVFGDIDTSYIEIKRGDKGKDKKHIIDAVRNIIKDYFTASNFSLGQTIDLFSLTNQILSIDGVESLVTVNGGTRYNGLAFYIWNAAYGVDLTSITQNRPLGDFQFAFFNDVEGLYNKIKVIDNE